MPEIDLILQDASQATDPEDELPIGETARQSPNLEMYGNSGDIGCYAEIPYRKIATNP